MSDEPTPEVEAQEAAPELLTETKPSKKTKADKKKPIEPPPSEGDQAAAPATDQSAPPAEAPAVEAAPADRDEGVFQQGVQALLRGEYDAADNYFGQALSTYRKQGDKAGQIDVLQQLGHLCYLRGSEAQAHEYYHQANLMRAV